MRLVDTTHRWFEMAGIDGSFDMGLALSFPIGVGAAFAPTPLQTLLIRGSEAKLKRVKRRDEDTIHHFRSHSAEFSHFLLIAVLETTFVGALLGVVAGVFAFVGQSLNSAHDYDIANLAFLGAQIFSLLG